MFDPSKVDEYSKQELVQFGIELREKKKEIDENIAIINTALVELH
jgi:hypothetical protein